MCGFRCASSAGAAGKRIVAPDGSEIVPTFSHGTLVKALARIGIGTTGPAH